MGLSSFALIDTACPVTIDYCPHRDLDAETKCCAALVRVMCFVTEAVSLLFSLVGSLSKAKLKTIKDIISKHTVTVGADKHQRAVELVGNSRMGQMDHRQRRRCVWDQRNCSDHCTLWLKCMCGICVVSDV